MLAISSLCVRRITIGRRRMHAPVIPLLASLLFPAAVDTLAGDAEAPFPTANRGPFLLPVGLPAATGATTLNAGESSWRATLELANTSLYEPSLCDGTCSLVVDGETKRLAVSVRRGFEAGWEATAMLPVLNHGGGFLDRAIEGWHDVFGLPNGDRDAYPRDRLLYQYRPGSDGAAVSEDVTGLGDLQLGIGRRLGERFALRGNLKLPTGDAGDLTGSGGADAALSLHFSSNGNGGVSAPGERIYAHLSAGVLASEDGDLLPAERERWVYFGSATVGWRATDRWHLKAQVDAHSAAWDSPREHLGEPSAQLVLGASGALGKSWTLDLAFSEDIVVERSPDIVFQIGVRWRRP